VSRSLNKVILIGNLGADPEVRSTSNGSRVATLSLATSRQWKNQSGEKQEKTEWHRVILWNNKGSGLADIAEKRDQIRAAWRPGHGKRMVAGFAEQDFIFRPDRFKPCIDALGIERLARPVDEPSPRRIEPRDPAKIENHPPCAVALH
jgi:hypothetical protein